MNSQHAYINSKIYFVPETEVYTFDKKRYLVQIQIEVKNIYFSLQKYVFIHVNRKLENKVFINVVQRI